MRINAVLTYGISPYITGTTTMPTVHPPANPVAMPIDMGSSSKAAVNESDLSSSAPSGKAHIDFVTAAWCRPLRVSFIVQYTELGFEALYLELAALQTDAERTRHIKRCLIDIVRGDFKRPDAMLFCLGEHNKESFKIEIRLSSRDVGLEKVYDELRALPTTFSRTYALRRKLFNAFQPQPQAGQPTALPELPRLAIYLPAESVPGTEPLSTPSLTNTPTLDQLNKRRQVARQSIAAVFEIL